MNDPVDVITLQNQLEKLQKSLEEGFAAFGASCASAERLTPLGACHEEWAAYDACLNDVSKGQRDFQRLKHHLEAVTDANARIKDQEAKLKQMALDKESLAPRLGAAAYEAYLSGHGQELIRFVDPVFHDYAAACRGCSDTALGRLKLHNLERGSRKLFIKAGNLLFADEKYQLVPNASLVSEVNALLTRESEVRQNLASDRESVCGVKGMTDRGRLDAGERGLRDRQGQLERLAGAYGKAVFDQIPPPVIQQKVGEKAYQQGLQLLALQEAISQVSQRINRIEGNRKAEELEAEIALQKQRVQLLEEQKKELDKQISQLYGEMNELRRKVFKLRGETHV